MKNTVRPKKNLGQHFLIDETIARRIADTVDACPALPLLEIGPGMGALTRHLLEKRRELRVVEIDEESISYLRAHFPMLRSDIVAGDFLKMDLSEIFGGRQFVLTGNYPYNISSQIFFKLLDYRDLIPCCTGMLQKEVAERLCSGPGRKSYGILSVLLQAWYRAEYLFTVSPTAFSPQPKVESGVVRFVRNDVTRLDCDERLMKRIVKATFGQRRKMLRVSLRPFLNGLCAERGAAVPAADLTAFLSRPDLTRRPEQLGVADFVALTNDVDTLCTH